MRRAALVIFYLVVAGLRVHAQTLSIDPDETCIAPNGRVDFTVSNGDNPVPALTWAIDGSPAGFQITPYVAGTRARLTMTKDAAIPASGFIEVKATPSGGGSEVVALVNVGASVGGLITIPVIGFEQVGASAAESHQKFFFDFFISRPFPLASSGYCAKRDDLAGQAFGPKLRWWGGVRIASYPQQVTSGVGEFATGFATQVAQLKVNEVAQGGEFNTGLEWRFHSFPRPFFSNTSDDQERVAMSWVAGFGALSPFNPLQTLQIFATPPEGSPQRAAFLQQFPSSANSQFTGFITPDRDRFFWNYGAGIRLTTFLYNDKASGVAGKQTGSPAMVTYTLGQNQLVSGGLSRGIVQRLEAMFPLPLGDNANRVTTLYLFGRADMRLARSNQTPPFVLQPADPSIAGFDPRVNIATVRSTRDVYAIGVGGDAVKLIKQIASGFKKPQ